MGSFCHGTVESVLTTYITVWFGDCTTSDQKSLQCVLDAAGRIIGAPLHLPVDLNYPHLVRRLVWDPSHPLNSFFSLLQSLSTCSTRLPTASCTRLLECTTKHHKWLMSKSISPHTLTHTHTSPHWPPLTATLECNFVVTCNFILLVIFFVHFTQGSSVDGIPVPPILSNCCGNDNKASLNPFVAHGYLC